MSDRKGYYINEIRLDPKQTQFSITHKCSLYGKHII